MQKHRIEFVLTLLATLMVPISTAAQEMPPAQVKVVSAEYRKLEPVMELQGNVVSLNDAEISAEVAGQLLWIAEVGTKLKQGDVLAKIDDTLMQLELSKAKAVLASHKADLKFRQSEVERFKQLAVKDNASKARLQNELAQREMLQQDILQAKAQIAKVERDIAKAQVKAPFNGVLVNRLANIGENIKSDSILVRLVDTQSKEVSVSTPLSIIQYLKPGVEVEVNNAHGEQRLTIKTLVPVGDIISRMVEVRFSAKDTPWIVGESVSVLMPKGVGKLATVIPRDAIINRGQERFIYKVTGDSSAEKVVANITASVGEWVAVSSGVADGDKVIIRGAERLQPGQPIVVMP